MTQPHKTPTSTTSPAASIPLEAVRARLVERRDALLARLHKVQRDLRHGERPLEADSEEQAAQLANDDVLDALDDAGREQLALVRAALDRIERGTWGTCIGCGKPIAPRRLEAMPTTPHCTDCAR